VSLQTITANMKGILAAVQGVANVYDHKKWTNDDTSFNQAFKSGSAINTWMITREATQAQDRGPNNEFDIHQMVIAGYNQVAEAAGSEATFQQLVETVRATFNSNRKLTFNSAHAAYWSGAMSARAVQYVMFGGVLCHYCELVMNVEDGPNSTLSA
jgi:hypothetical protein